MTGARTPAPGASGGSMLCPVTVNRAERCISAVS